MLIRMLESAIIKGFDGLNKIMYQRHPVREENSSATILGSSPHPYRPERRQPASINEEIRRRHIYILGATGFGKTKLIEALIRQDILNRNGFALIDPHGDLTRNVLLFLAENSGEEELDELTDRLILVEPFNREWVPGFNPLESANGHFPAMLELVEIFRGFWADSYWGPRMDEVLRNTLVTLMENNLTLMEARPLLTQEEFRQRLTENVSFGEVRDYWIYRYNPLSERMQALYRESVLNKISAFVSDPMIYRIIGQRESTIMTSTRGGGMKNSEPLKAD
jgi:hypothetical protein